MAAAQRVAERLNLRTAVGLSPFAAGPERLHGALRQARIVLELARSGQLDVEEATTGTWRLLIKPAVADPDELAECVATSIGPAVDHDARLRTELVAHLPGLSRPRREHERDGIGHLRPPPHGGGAPGTPARPDAARPDVP